MKLVRVVKSVSSESIKALREKVFNFCPGPAALPTPVLEEAQASLLDYDGRGISIMEMSHRSPAFMEVIAQAEADLRELMAVPSNYKVLFMQGGARMQFAIAPMNFLSNDQPSNNEIAAYVDTGHWSQAAIKEAQRFAEVAVVASSKEQSYREIPDFSSWQIPEQAKFLHYTPNETLHGVEFSWVPEVGETPLIADMSSTILSRPIDVSKFGVIYAGAQKNIGPAGVTIVIVREDLLDRAPKHLPAMMSYRTYADSDSMFNTPPTFSIYLAGLVFKWLKAQGGLSVIAQQNKTKAERLYAAIDQSAFYANPVRPQDRSWMNVPFTLSDDSLNEKFLANGESKGLYSLKGHRAVGGMRASIYNAVPLAGVDALIQHMSEFEREQG